MRKMSAALGSIAFFVLAPGVFAGLLPWVITDWQADRTWLPAQVCGVVLIVAGVAALVQAFVQFVVEGLGTPAPVAAPQRLVVRGLYRYVRNPMYVAVVITIVGQALLFGHPGLLGYAAVIVAAFVAFVHGYEEPELSSRFGDQYVAYRAGVRRWWPRLTPWRPHS